jgi:hypothetical protein
MRYAWRAANSWSELIELLDAKNVIFTEGLTDSEVLRIESGLGFRFPDDLRDFLQAALPRGFSFPDWRSGDESTLTELLNLPLNGILFDVEHNGFWLPEWGPRPETIAEAGVLVEQHIRQAPKLIPINGHRMMPDQPRSAGNPVLSIHQTDIIFYGFDLDDYLRHEFDLPDRKPWPSENKQIEFWDVDRWQAVRWK